MPSLVMRWQGLGAQYPALARLRNEATVCGVFCSAGGLVHPAASFWPASRPFAPVVGLASAPLDAEPLGVAVDVGAAAGAGVSELPTILGTTMTAAMTRMTARITPNTCLSRVESLTGGFALLSCSSWRRRARARSCSLVTNLSSDGPLGVVPGRSVILWTATGAHAAGPVTSP